MIMKWAAAIRAVPHSKMFLKARQLADSFIRDRIVSMFAAAGRPERSLASRIDGRRHECASRSLPSHRYRAGYFPLQRNDNALRSSLDGRAGHHFERQSTSLPRRCKLTSSTRSRLARCRKSGRIRLNRHTTGGEPITCHRPSRDDASTLRQFNARRSCSVHT